MATRTLPLRGLSGDAERKRRDAARKRCKHALARGRWRRRTQYGMILALGFASESPNCRRMARYGMVGRALPTRWKRVRSMIVFYVATRLATSRLENKYSLSNWAGGLRSLGHRWAWWDHRRSMRPEELPDFYAFVGLLAVSVPGRRLASLVGLMIPLLTSAIEVNDSPGPALPVECH